MPATVLLAAVVVAVAVLQSHPEFRLASAGPSTDVVMVVAAGCKGGTDSDFNGDGYRDTAIADPKATVNGLADAGRVSVVYGNVDDLHPDGGLIDVLQQGAGGIPGGAEAGDEFGHALAVYDANKDGCSDLVVSAPFEDTGAAVDGGAAVVLFGSPSGLGKGPATIWYDQNAPGWGDDNESGDWFGYSLTAG
ncbi:MAG TPA: integrin alpha, partial [Actinoplanes sp.]